jgi:hypothetical protein
VYLVLSSSTGAALFRCVGESHVGGGGDSDTTKSASAKSPNWSNTCWDHYGLIHSRLQRLMQLSCEVPVRRMIKLEKRHLFAALVICDDSLCF